MSQEEKGNKTRRLVCIITGRSLLAAAEYYQKKVEKAGSEEMLHKTYVCREARDLLLRGHSVEEIRKLLGSTVSTPIPDETINQIITLKMKNKAVAKPQIQLHVQTDPDVVQFLKTL